MIRVRLRSATARTPATRTSENKADTMRSPPLISSTKGAQMKKATSAIRSCTAEKRRNLSGHLINDVVMLSEAKHLCSWSLGNRPKKHSEILRFAQNDISYQRRTRFTDRFLPYDSPQSYHAG